MEQTANEIIMQVNEINQLFSKTQELVKKNAPKTYSKELIELLFEYPYCKSEYLTKRLGISRITASKYLKELQVKQVWKETLYINTKLFDLLKK